MLAEFEARVCKEVVPIMCALLDCDAEASGAESVEQFAHRMHAAFLSPRHDEEPVRSTLELLYFHTDTSCISV